MSSLCAVVVVGRLGRMRTGRRAPPRRRDAREVAPVPRHVRLVVIAARRGRRRRAAEPAAPLEHPVRAVETGDRADVLRASRRIPRRTCSPDAVGSSRRRAATSPTRRRRRRPTSNRQARASRCGSISAPRGASEPRRAPRTRLVPAGLSDSPFGQFPRVGTEQVLELDDPGAERGRGDAEQRPGNRAGVRANWTPCWLPSCRIVHGTVEMPLASVSKRPGACSGVAWAAMSSGSSIVMITVRYGDGRPSGCRARNRPADSPSYPVAQRAQRFRRRRKAPDGTARYRCRRRSRNQPRQRCRHRPQRQLTYSRCQHTRSTGETGAPMAGNGDRSRRYWSRSSTTEPSPGSRGGEVRRTGPALAPR